MKIYIVLFVFLKYFEPNPIYSIILLALSYFKGDLDNMKMFSSMIKIKKNLLQLITVLFSIFVIPPIN